MAIEDHINARFKDEQHKAVVNIRFTSNWIGAFYNNQLADYNLTLPQFNILRILRGANEALSVQVIRERMLEKSPNTTRLIQKLVDKKFVERKKSKHDKRIYLLSLTNQGRKILTKIDEFFDDLSGVDKVSEEEAVILNRLLDKLRGE